MKCLHSVGINNVYTCTYTHTNTGKLLSLKKKKKQSCHL